MVSCNVQADSMLWSFWRLYWACGGVECFALPVYIIEGTFKMRTLLSLQYQTVQKHHKLITASNVISKLNQHFEKLASTKLNILTFMTGGFIAGLSSLTGIVSSFKDYLLDLVKVKKLRQVTGTSMHTFSHATLKNTVGRLFRYI